MSEKSAADLALELIQAATGKDSAKRVQELVAAKKAHEAEVAKAKALNDQADRKLDAAHDALQTAKGKEADSEAKRVRLEKLETELAEKKRHLDQREQQVLDKERSVSAAHSAAFDQLTRKQAELASNQAALNRRANLIADQERDYKERISRLRALAG